MPASVRGASVSPSASQAISAAIGALSAKSTPVRRGPSRFSVAKSSESPTKMPRSPDSSSGPTTARVELPPDPGGGNVDGEETGGEDLPPAVEHQRAEMPGRLRRR